MPFIVYPQLSREVAAPLNYLYNLFKTLDTVLFGAVFGSIIFDFFAKIHSSLDQNHNQ